jgi:hypothetical protein
VQDGKASTEAISAGSPIRQKTRHAYLRIHHNILPNLYHSSHGGDFLAISQGPVQPCGGGLRAFIGHKAGRESHNTRTEILDKIHEHLEHIKTDALLTASG